MIFTSIGRDEIAKDLTGENFQLMKSSEYTNTLGIAACVFFNEDFANRNCDDSCLFEQSNI